MRLWLPQLFTMVSNFEVTKSIVDFPYERNLCGMIAYSVNQSSMNMDSIAANGTCEQMVVVTPKPYNLIYFTELFNFRKLHLRFIQTPYSQELQG